MSILFKQSLGDVRMLFVLKISEVTSEQEKNQVNATSRAGLEAKEDFPGERKWLIGD